MWMVRAGRGGDLIDDFATYTGCKHLSAIGA